MTIAMMGVTRTAINLVMKVVIHALALNLVPAPLAAGRVAAATTATRIVTRAAIFARRAVILTAPILVTIIALLVALTLVMPR